MKIRSSMLVVTLLATVVTGAAQTAPPKRQTIAPRPSANALARSQFAAASEEYRAQTGSIELRDKVIQLARAVNPAPAVPEGALSFFTQGMTQIQKSANAEDLKAAAKLFEQAAQAAPWYSDAYYNLAGSYDKMGDYDKEKETLRVYVTTLRSDANVKAAQDLIKEADLKQEQAEFDQALAGIKRDPADVAARQKLVHQAASSDPPLAVPEETERYMVRGKIAFEESKEVKDFKDAVIQFERARDAAPWYGPVYYSLGVAQSAAGDYKSATDNLSVYLAWSLDATQTKAAKELIYQIEYRQEKAQAEDAKRQAEADAEHKTLQTEQALLAGLNGIWTCKQGCSTKATVNLNQAAFTFTFGQGWTLNGTLNGFAVEGLMTQPAFYDSDSTCKLPSSTHKFSGTISEDGKTIVINTEETKYATHWYNSGGLFGTTTCTDYSVLSVDPLIITVYRDEASVPPAEAPPRRKGK